MSKKQSGLSALFYAEKCLRTFFECFCRRRVKWLLGVGSVPLVACADPVDGGKVEQMLRVLIDLVKGPWGLSIATLAVMGTGFACFVLGRVPMSRLVTVVIGAACVVGAPRLMEILAAA